MFFGLLVLDKILLYHGNISIDEFIFFIKKVRGIRAEYNKKNKILMNLVYIYSNAKIFISHRNFGGDDGI